MVSAILQFETIGDTKVGLNKCHHVDDFDVWSPAARAGLNLEHRSGLSFKKLLLKLQLRNKLEDKRSI